MYSVRYAVLLTPALKKKFQDKCAQKGQTGTYVLRNLLMRWLKGEIDVRPIK